MNVNSASEKIDSTNRSVIFYSFPLRRTHYMGFSQDFYCITRTSGIPDIRQKKLRSVSSITINVECKGEGEDQ